MIETEDEYNLVMQKLSYYFDNQDSLNDEQSRDFIELVSVVEEYEKDLFPI